MVSDFREVFVAIWNLIVTVFCKVTGREDLLDKYIKGEKEAE